MEAQLVTDVRLHVLHTAMVTTKIPSAAATAAALGISEEHAMAAYGELAEAHVYVAEPNHPGRLRMANPFSAVPTTFGVEVGAKHYFGNCIWDALAIVSLLGGSGRVVTLCPDCGETLRLDVADGRLLHQEGIVHFSVPAAHWWDDIVFT